MSIETAILSAIAGVICGLVLGLLAALCRGISHLVALFLGATLLAAGIVILLADFQSAAIFVIALVLTLILYNRTQHKAGLKCKLPTKSAEELSLGRTKHRREMEYEPPRRYSYSEAETERVDKSSELSKSAEESSVGRTISESEHKLPQAAESEETSIRTKYKADMEYEPPRGYSYSEDETEKVDKSSELSKSAEESSVGRPPERWVPPQQADSEEISLPAKYRPAPRKSITKTGESRIVNTGFILESQPNDKLDPNTPLFVDKLYYFWLEVGKLLEESIEKKAVPLTKDIPEGARLVVALFPFKDELQIFPGSDIGELILQSGGTSLVIGKKPAIPDNVSKDILGRRLFFPVRTPNRAGRFSLRCSIYYNQILIQSRLVRVVVSYNPESTQDALESVVDYALAEIMHAEHLTALGESHRLSLMLNSNGDDTHTFTFFGANGGDGFKSASTINAGDLKTSADLARDALRKVSWGSGDPFNNAMEYRYQNYDLDRLEEDLIFLAERGVILYDSMIRDLSQDEDQELSKLMLSPGGRIQIALRQSPKLILPAGLFYDYPLGTNNPDTPLKLCDEFVRSLKSDRPLEETECFKGRCPNYDKLDYVCPSGFWGFRHYLGFPVSLRKGEMPTEISFKDSLEIVVGGEYKSLKMTGDHVKRLKSIRDNINLHNPLTRNQILDDLKSTRAQLIYFYCHGGYREDIKLPYLQFDDGNIAGYDLQGPKIAWPAPPHPLVFINGCHTAALDPEQAYNLVESFVERGCAGVIGTEITIFEQLACEFAEECLKQFLAGDKTIGHAIHAARLELLKKGNPLGLVYTPYATTDLSLVKN